MSATVRNAVECYARTLPRASLGRIARAVQPRLRDGRAGPLRTAGLRRLVVEQFELDLAGFLNHCVRAELDELAAAAALSSAGGIGELRARLWLQGAAWEAGAPQPLGSPVQPVPVVLGGRLVHLGSAGGLAPPGGTWPRPVPEPPAAVVTPGAEPDTLEELIEAADRLLGVRLGPQPRDKGAFGSAVARLLGLVEDGNPEPDWRGEVEIKVVPVVRDRAGWWKVKEDPAVSMEGARPLDKLRKVLWIARVADSGDSPLLSWFYQEWDEAVARLVARHLHTRPKGGAGTSARGYYLHKRFFAESGFLRALNGG